MRRISSGVLAAVCCSSFSLAGMASAQSGAYPTRTIQILTPSSPGGSLDLLARIMAEQLEPRLKVPVVVANRPGAAGVVSAMTLKRSVSDGYTLLLANDAVVTLPIYAKAAEYDSETDFTPIAMLSRNPYFFFVSAKLPINSLQDLVEYAKTNPGKVNFAQFPNSDPYFYALRFQQTAGIDTSVIPYNNTGQVVPNLMQNLVHVIIGSPAAWLQYVRNGVVRAIAVTGSKRSQLLPLVPLAKDSGIPLDFEEWGTWAGLFGPAPLPKDVVAVLVEAIVEVARKPEVDAQIRKMGNEPAPLPSHEFGNLVARHVASARVAAKSAGAKPQ